MSNSISAKPACSLPKILHERLLDSIERYNRVTLDLDPMTNIFRTNGGVKRIVDVLSVVLLGVCLRQGVDFMENDSSAGRLWLHVQRNIGQCFEADECLHHAQVFLNAHAWNIDSPEDIDAKQWSLDEFVELVKTVEIMSRQTDVPLEASIGMVLHIVGSNRDGK